MSSANSKANSLSFSADDTFRISPEVRNVCFGARTALFSAEQQQIAELNETAALLWRWLEDGRSASAMTRALVEAGAEAAAADAFVADALSQWLEQDYIAPTTILDSLEQPPAQLLPIGIGAFRADLALYGDAAPEIAAVFAHLRTQDTTPAPLRLNTYRRDGVDFLFQDSVPLDVCPPDESAPHLKAMLTEAYCDSIVDGFLAHGALLTIGAKTIFLGGEPGAGKTTLTLALCQAGAGFCGDDIVHVRADALVSGAPFAAAVKTGAWPILAPLMPELFSAPIHTRTDGQHARYIAPPIGPNAPRPLDIAIFLQRDGAPTQLTPIDPLDAPCRFIESGYASAGELDAETFAALAERFAAIACYRLDAGDLDKSVRLVTDAARA